MKEDEANYKRYVPRLFPTARLKTHVRAGGTGGTR